VSETSEQNAPSRRVGRPRRHGSEDDQIQSAALAQRPESLIQVARATGTLFAEVAHPPHILHNMGAAMGRMDVALQAFTHPSLRRNLQWDLALVLGVRAFVPHVTQPDRRALAETWLSEFETAVLPCAAKLLLPKQVRSVPGSVVHNTVPTPHHQLGRAPLSEALWVPLLVELCASSWVEARCGCKPGA